MNAVVQAVPTRIAIIPEISLGRNCLTEQQEKALAAVMGIVSTHKPRGRYMTVVVPDYESDSELALTLFRRHGARLVACDKLRSCNCKRDLKPICDCLARFMGPQQGLVTAIVPRERTMTMAENLRKSMKRECFIECQEILPDHPAFVF